MTKLLDRYDEYFSMRLLYDGGGNVRVNAPCLIVVCIKLRIMIIIYVSILMAIGLNLYPFTFRLSNDLGGAVVSIQVSQS